MAPPASPSTPRNIPRTPAPPAQASAPAAPRSAAPRSSPRRNTQRCRRRRPRSCGPSATASAASKPAVSRPVRKSAARRSSNRSSSNLRSLSGNLRNSWLSPVSLCLDDDCLDDLRLTSPLPPLSRTRCLGALLRPHLLLRSGPAKSCIVTRCC